MLEKLEATLARMKKEVEKRNSAKILEEKRRQKMLEEKKIRQEKILRQEQERADKKIKKRMMAERWAMAKWLTR